MRITVINTGGTFNKRYNPIKGQLEVPIDNIALDKILKSCHNLDINVKNIISKDSLDMNDVHREQIVDTIKSSENENIIIIHGTDTVNQTALFIEKQINDKKIVLTGAMIPMSIDEVEATMNFSLAIGFLNAHVNNGIYLAMHGVVSNHKELVKDKSIGKFLIK